MPSDIDKRYKIGRVSEMIEKVKAAEINSIGNYIFGMAEDDHASMKQTLAISTAVTGDTHSHCQR